MSGSAVVAADAAISIAVNDGIPTPVDGLDLRSHRGHLLSAIGVTDVIRQCECIVAVETSTGSVPLVEGRHLPLHVVIRLATKSS